jgi:hypothetical protein
MTSVPAPACPLRAAKEITELPALLARFDIRSYLLCCQSQMVVAAITEPSAVAHKNQLSVS